MKRNDFEKVVRAFSDWRIVRRKGDYSLSCGNLSDYLNNLVHELLQRNNLAFRSNGELGEVITDGEKAIILVPFGENEDVVTVEQERLIDMFVKNI